MFPRPFNLLPPCCSCNPTPDLTLHNNICITGKQRAANVGQFGHNVVHVSNNCLYRSCVRLPPWAYVCLSTGHTSEMLEHGSKSVRNVVPLGGRPGSTAQLLALWWYHAALRVRGARSAPGYTVAEEVHTSAVAVTDRALSVA